jgi:hypothetical protein
VRIPLENVEFEERGAEVAASVELTFNSAAPDGGKSEPQTVKVPIRFRKKEGTNGVRGTFTYDAEFFVKKGDYRFVVTARDLGSNRVGSAEASARVE